jgi:hypothetical protein
LEAADLAMLSPPFLGLLVAFSFVLDCALLPLPMAHMQPGLGACHAHLIRTLLKLFGKRTTVFDDLVSDLEAQPRALLASVSGQPCWTLTNLSCLVPFCNFDRVQRYLSSPPSLFSYSIFPCACPAEVGRLHGSFRTADGQPGTRVIPVYVFDQDTDNPAWLDRAQQAVAFDDMVIAVTGKGPWQASGFQ